MEFITDKEIEASVTSLEVGEGVAASGFNFCTAWPTAKTVLEFLSNAPGYGWVVKIVIAMGEALYKAKCP